MNLTEILGFVTGAACVLLAARENVWNWPIGIANEIFFFILFWHSKLYADAVLQIVYLVVSLYGWWLWLYGGKQRSQLPITRVSRSGAIILGLVTAGATVAIYAVLSKFTDSNVPLGDAITTALSLVAQYMLGRKLIENWAVWITADFIYIALYSYKHLYLTAALYAIFIVMCVSGYLHWQRSLNAQIGAEPA